MFQTLHMENIYKWLPGFNIQDWKLSKCVAPEERWRFKKIDIFIRKDEEEWGKEKSSKNLNWISNIMRYDGLVKTIQGQIKAQVDKKKGKEWLWMFFIRQVNKDMKEKKTKNMER